VHERHNSKRNSPDQSCLRPRCASPNDKHDRREANAPGQQGASQPPCMQKEGVATATRDIHRIGVDDIARACRDSSEELCCGRWSVTPAHDAAIGEARGRIPGNGNVQSVLLLRKRERTPTHRLTSSLNRAPNCVVSVSRRA
jgi:hypothetical protein